MPDKGLIYKFVACDNEGKPPAPLVCSPKVDAYLSDFTIPQSLDLSLIDSEKPDLFQVLKLIYFRILILVTRF